MHLRFLFLLASCFAVAAFVYPAGGTVFSPQKAPSLLFARTPTNKKVFMDGKVQPYVKGVLYDEIMRGFELERSASNTELKRISADLLSAQGRLNGRGVVEYLLRNIFHELRPVTDKTGMAKPLSSAKFKVATTFDYIHKQQATGQRAPPFTQRFFDLLEACGQSVEDAERLYEKQCDHIHDKEWAGPGVSIDWSVYSPSERKLLTAIVEELDLVVVEDRREE